MEKVISFKPRQEYKVVHVREGFLGVLFLGQSTINTRELESTLNRYASDGWHVLEMFTEKRRKFFFWSVDSVIVVFARDRG